MYSEKSGSGPLYAGKYIDLDPDRGSRRKICPCKGQESCFGVNAEKVTVNLDSRSTLDPEDFWKSMQLIAVTNKAMMRLNKN